MIIYIGQSFPSNWVGGISFNLVYKSAICPLICEIHIFSNSQYKVGINFIKNSCASHKLLKNGHMSLL
jgi:hypothetical protein